MYDTNLKRNWDNQAALDYARYEGMEKGKEEVVRNLLAGAKFTIAEIANFAGVTEAFVKKIKSGNKN